MAPILQWAGLAVLVLLAMVGLYYLYLLCRGYRCLPLTTADCPGNKPHHLVYVDDEELAALAKIAKHTGKPCHGIRSYPPKPKRRKDQQTRTVGVVGGEPIEVDYSPHESVHDFARKFGRKYKETRGVDPPVHFYRENADDDGEAVVALNVGSSEYLPTPLEDGTDFTIVPGDRAWETNMAQYDPAAGEPATYQAVIPAEDQWVKRPSYGPKTFPQALIGARVRFPRMRGGFHDYGHAAGWDGTVQWVDNGEATVQVLDDDALQDEDREDFADWDGYAVVDLDDIKDGHVRILEPAQHPHWGRWQLPAAPRPDPDPLPRGLRHLVE